MDPKEIRDTIQVAKDTTGAWVKPRSVNTRVCQKTTPVTNMFGSSFHSVRPQWPSKDIQDNRNRLCDLRDLFAFKAKTAAEKFNITEDEFDDKFEQLRNMVDDIVDAAKKCGRAEANLEIAVSNGASDIMEAVTKAKENAQDDLEYFIGELDDAIEPYGKIQDRFRDNSIRYGMMVGAQTGFHLASMQAVFVEQEDAEETPIQEIGIVQFDLKEAPKKKQAPKK